MLAVTNLVLFLILGFFISPILFLPTPSINIILLKILRCQAAKVESAIAEGVLLVSGMCRFCFAIIRTKRITTPNSSDLIVLQD